MAVMASSKDDPFAAHSSLYSLSTGGFAVPVTAINYKNILMT